MNGWTLACEQCHETHPLNSLHWQCPVCGGAFALLHSGQFAHSDIVQERHSLWRYSGALPVGFESAKSLGEGMTPLVRGMLAGREVWLKNDALLPTGSFKDRGAAVLVAHLKRLGIAKVIVDSSGNAAAAMAGYCSAAGIGCVVFAPASTSPGKLTQSRAYGAEVILVEGNRDAVARAAQMAAEQDAAAYYASHNWNPIFVEGVTTWAMEVWEQLGRRLPEVAFVPTGGGSALVGAQRGFATTGGRQPALVACQPEACAPIVAAYERDTATIAPLTPGDTIAEGTRIGSPARPQQILSAVREHGGRAQAVSEDQIKRALRELWAQGLYVEPTAAVGAAAFIETVEHQRLAAGDEAVILLTGSGLKATDTIARILAKQA